MVKSATSGRARVSREGVMEMLAVDQPARDVSPDRSSHFWAMADQLAVDADAVRQWLPGQGERGQPTVHHVADREASLVQDRSHSAMAVDLDACIECNLCVRACREVQGNDVIGLAHRGAASKIVFDFDDPMGESTCVACGECVQACPTGALMPSTLVDAAGRGDSKVADRTVDSVCPYCGVGCQLTYHIKDEKILYVEGRDGPSNQNRLCVKGRFGFDYPYHPSRLTRPLIRRSGVPKGLDPDFDPATPLTHFREADWEEALDLAAKGLVGLKAAHGPDALAGFGSAKCSNEEAWLFQKLVRTGFGSNHVDHCTRLCHASSVAALMECIGSGAVTASFMQALDADVVILTGCNPAINHPVAATYFKQAARNGTKLIILDPRGQALDAYAHRSVRFTPGGDVSLYNAMLNVIVEEALYDQAYIDAHTEGFEALKAHVRDLTPEAMSPACGIAPDQIRELARLYARADKAMIFWGMGISQHVHGTDNARCLISLALACGQTGRPGTGLHPLRGQNNVQGASDAGMIPMVLPDYQPVTDARCAAPSRSCGTPRSTRRRGSPWWKSWMPSPPAPSRGCTSSARTRPCPTRTWTMPGRPWPSSSTWWCRTCSSPRPPSSPMSSCRPRPGRRRTAASPTPTARCSWAAPPYRCPLMPSPTGGSSSSSPIASAWAGTTPTRARYSPR
ncbi:hypothetical protein Q427_11230 [Halomonas sp. BC04]|nr:hypothetical protein Q427_11230 [Halomonas sp. BC04]